MKKFLEPVFKLIASDRELFCLNFKLQFLRNMQLFRRNLAKEVGQKSREARQVKPRKILVWRQTLVISSLLLSACTFLQNIQKPSEIDYLDKATKADIKKFFSGDVEGFAIVQDQSGKIIDTKTMKINGKWEDNKGIIQQSFVFSNGKKDSRTWLITVEDSGNYTAVGHDVVAPARGRQIGNAIQMTYKLLLEGQNGKEEIEFDDRIYLVDDKSAIMISDSGKNYNSEKSIFSLKKIN